MVSRRTFLKDLGKGIIFVASYPAFTGNLVSGSELSPTPSNTEGPYYLPGAPLQTNLRVQGDSGTPLVVSGVIVDTTNKPISRALIEIWHADSSGHYDLNGFHYRSSLRSNASGEYSFKTFMPGNYGGRPRHIHYKITSDAFERLVTQLYFEDDPFFEGTLERTIRKDPLVQHRELIRPVIPYRQGDRQVVFKICLARSHHRSADILVVPTMEV